MPTWQAALGLLLDGVDRRWTALAERRRRANLLAGRVEEARRRYRALDRDRQREVRRAARRLSELRERLAQLTGSPQCCADCTRRLALATGQATPLLPGGFCCGGDPARIFDELEVAALWLAGRAPSSRNMARRPDGCWYRGRNGCRLQPVRRPNVCARYLCRELTEALARSGALADIMECNDALEVEMARIGGALGLLARSQQPQRMRDCVVFARP